MKFKIEYGFLSHKGKARKKNEDSVLVSPEFALAAVADGMGGHKSGHIASKLATKVFKKVISDMQEGLIISKAKKPKISYTADKLFIAAKQANKVILKEAQKHQKNKGMGTTLSAIMLSDNNASIIHIGDSRIYLFRKNKLSQLTKDHSLVTEQLDKGFITKEEAQVSTMQHILTQALGVHKNPHFDIIELKVFVGDILLVCSDGLFKPLDNGQIFKILSAKISMQHVCQKLINSANAKGGPDNISAIAMKLNPPPLSHKIKETVKNLFK
jgi:protein phosphatase